MQSRFRDELVLVLLADDKGPLTRDGRSLWILQRPLSFRAGNEGHVITVPAGFITDLASIPRPVWSLFPPDGPWAKAVVVHDFLYETRGTGVWRGQGGVGRGTPYSRREADGILLEAMADQGIGWFARHVMWTAVRLGGGRSWKNLPPIGPATGP